MTPRGLGLEGDEKKEGEVGSAVKGRKKIRIPPKEVLLFISGKSRLARQEKKEGREEKEGRNCSRYKGIAPIEKREHRRVRSGAGSHSGVET